MTREESDAVDDIVTALAMDDIPRVHMARGHVVPDVRHRRLVSPWLFVPVALLSMVLGIIIGMRFI